MRPKFLDRLFGSQTAEAKNLAEARAQNASAMASAEVVAALFAAVPLDLDAMIEAGPDSLKAYIDGRSAKDGELAAAQAEIVRLKGAVDTVGKQLAAAVKLQANYGECFKAIGMAGEDSMFVAEQVKALFDVHVKQAAALELAKTGHAPVADVPPPAPGKTQAIDPTLTGAARTKAFFASKLTSKK